MKIFVVSDGRCENSAFENSTFNGSAYLAEILMAFGLPFHERSTLSLALAKARPQRDVIVLPRASAAHGVEEFLRAGGNVIAIQPETSLAAIAGLESVREENGTSQTRFVQPVCRGTRGQALWTHGPLHIYQPNPEQPNPEAPQCQVIAYSFKAADPSPDSIGVAEYSVGAGKLVVYAYDPVQCIIRLRQGDPQRADFLPPGELTPRLGFLQTPKPPPDTFWRPTADLHALAFCGIVQRMLERSTPVPTLWHLPDGAPATLLFSGDEDAAPLDADETQLSEIETFDAAMNLYIFPGNTPLSREKIEEFSRRGHTISAHPFLSETSGQPREVQLQEAENQVRLFQERFARPVHTVRNHSYMWPGYMEIPELWEKLGIGMDCNSTSLMRGESMEWGPFAKLNAAMPLRFVREDGTLIDVFQQPTQINDDLMLHPNSPKTMKYSAGEADALMERIFDDAIRVDHSPLCVNFHPENYIKFSAEPARAILQRAKDLELPIWSIEHWHNFWRARSSWKIETSDWDGTALTMTLQGEPCEGLSLFVPVQFNEKTLRGVLCDGQATAWEVISRRGREVASVAISSNSTCATLRAEYSA